MKVINILKDGTVVEDMRKITVPKEIVGNVANIAQIKTIKEKSQNGNKNQTRAVS